MIRFPNGKLVYFRLQNREFDVASGCMKPGMRYCDYRVHSSFSHILRYASVQRGEPCGATDKKLNFVINALSTFEIVNSAYLG